MFPGCFYIVVENVALPTQSSPEQAAYREVLAALIAVYDDVSEIPDLPPNEILKYMMDERVLKQADLVEVVGSRSQVSDMVSGRRGISKAQAKKLAGYFRVNAEIFL